MERVKKGEWYYYVDINHGVEPMPMTRKEMGEREDLSNFYCNNYFHTWKQAESMTEKIRKVFKGAEVIEKK